VARSRSSRPRKCRNSLTLSLFKEIERLKKESKEKDERGDMWWNSYQDEQKRNARIRKAIEAAKTVLEMC
jgi:mevalonate pyrophosphate decarboxylase